MSSVNWEKLDFVTHRTCAVRITIPPFVCINYPV